LFHDFVFHRVQARQRGGFIFSGLQRERGARENGSAIDVRRDLDERDAGDGDAGFDCVAQRARTAKTWRSP